MEGDSGRNIDPPSRHGDIANRAIDLSGWRELTRSETSPGGDEIAIHRLGASPSRGKPRSSERRSGGFKSPDRYVGTTSPDSSRSPHPSRGKILVRTEHKLPSSRPIRTPGETSIHQAGINLCDTGLRLRQANRSRSRTRDRSNGPTRACSRQSIDPSCRNGPVSERDKLVQDERSISQSVLCRSQARSGPPGA